jgi:hypothetical protein
MRWSKSLAVLIVSSVLVVAAPAGAAPQAHTACSSGYRSATIKGAHKCLHAGEYCSRSSEREYVRYGYECSASYSPPRLRRR